jgi:putative transposase
MPQTNTPLVENEVYHIITKSIAGYKIFNTNEDYERFCNILLFYTATKLPWKFSDFPGKKSYDCVQSAIAKINSPLRVQIIAFSLMSTHLHLTIKQNINNGVSEYMKRVLESYTRYFNYKHKRKGPLWESRFKNILVETDEQLLHLTRYVHLNPVTAGIVDNPKDWKFSSYLEYLGNGKRDSLADYKGLIEIKKADYIKFVEERKDYQKELAIIKHLIS